eukprot:GEMP01105065.1.p1 GENE.GEMP01105065.1~~GEMP01105065.1.p1  ORF type:complete len:190 (-),score=23.70 GEMP01105065.1:21-590(-)
MSCTRQRVKRAITLDEHRSHLFSEVERNQIHRRHSGVNQRRLGVCVPRDIPSTITCLSRLKELQSSTPIPHDGLVLIAQAVHTRSNRSEWLEAAYTYLQGSRLDHDTLLVVIDGASTDPALMQLALEKALAAGITPTVVRAAEILIKNENVSPEVLQIAKNLLQSYRSSLSQTPQSNFVSLTHSQISVC